MVGQVPDLDWSNHVVAKRLAAAVDTAADAIVMINEQGQIQTFNQSAERMFGYSRREVLGQDVGLLMPRSHRSRHPAYLANYLQSGRPKVIGTGRETVARRKNGTVFPIELAVSEATDSDSRTFTAVIRDISERRTLEAEFVHESVRQQQRLSFDLHDGVCQELAGIAFAVQSLEQRVRTGQPLEGDALASVTGLLQDAVRHARELAHGLYPVRPQPDGLAAALQQLAEDSNKSLRVHCVFSGVPTVLVQNVTVAACFYRIAQEGIRQAVSQGKADQIDIQLNRKRDSLTLIVSDNGRAASANRRYRESIIFRVMQYWANAIGAKLHMKPAKAGNGVRLICELQNLD